MDAAMLTVIAATLAAALAVQLCLLALLAWRTRIVRPAPGTPWLDVPVRAVSGALPCGGVYELVAGLSDGEPILASGVVVIDVHSDLLRVFEVWARTDHGWIQLQPGPGEGAFRNSLVAGIRLSALRLWLAPVDGQPDESGVRAAAGLLVPAALLLTRVRPTSELGRSPRVPSKVTPVPARQALGVPAEAHTPVD
jgi:hypothetical protein